MRARCVVARSAVCTTQRGLQGSRSRCTRSPTLRPSSGPTYSPIHLLTCPPICARTRQGNFRTDRIIQIAQRYGVDEEACLDNVIHCRVHNTEEVSTSEGAGAARRFSS